MASAVGLAAAGNPPKESIAGKFGHWFAIYGAYLFLAGWSYLDYYFKVFGIDSRFLDIGFNDIVATGFAVLFGTGKWLSLIYLGILTVSLVMEIFIEEKSRARDMAAATLLVFLFIPTYLSSREAGREQANTDRGKGTKLATIEFNEKACSYRGKLLYVKGELLYVHDLKDITGDDAKKKTESQKLRKERCPIELDSEPSPVPQLWLVRASDLSDVRVIHFEQEAKP